MASMQITEEFRVSREDREAIRALLESSFPEEPFTRSRTYLKQAPPWRLLARSDGQLVGHAGIEHRVIALGSAPARIFGIADLCVHPSWRRRGIASAMLREVEELAVKAEGEFIILFARDPRLYERNGYGSHENVVRWVKIHEHQIIGVGCETVPELMVKPLTARPWLPTVVDLLGHLF